MMALSGLCECRTITIPLMSRKSMAPDRKPSAAFWIAVALVVALVAYPLSFGPACWLSEWIRLPSFADRGLRRIYCPLANYAIGESNPAAMALRWWSCLGAKHGAWNLQIDAELKVTPRHSPPYF
jgi:hypothetical protein